MSKKNGTGSVKVGSYFTSGNLTFHEKVAANGGQLIFGDAQGGLDVKFVGTATTNNILFDESANALKFNGISVQGSTVASASFEITAYGTAYLEVISVQNSTGDLKVKLGFLAAAPTSQLVNTVQIGATTAYTTALQDAVNDILTLAKAFGFMATS